MILKGKNVELIPVLGWEDWEYIFKLAKAHDNRLTGEMIVREAMEDGFQFYIGYHEGQRGGVVFAKHYRDGLSLDAYCELKGRAALSLEAGHLMLEHLLKFTSVVYVRIERGDLKLHRLCKALGLKWHHQEKSRDVYAQKKEEYTSFNWDTNCNQSFAENTRV